MWKPAPLRNGSRAVNCGFRTLLTGRARDQENRLQAGILKAPIWLLSVCTVALKPNACCTPASQVSRKGGYRDRISKETESRKCHNITQVTKHNLGAPSPILHFIIQSWFCLNAKLMIQISARRSGKGQRMEIIDQTILHNKLHVYKFMPSFLLARKTELRLFWLKQELLFS